MINLLTGIVYYVVISTTLVLGVAVSVVIIRMCYNCLKDYMNTWR